MQPYCFFASPAIKHVHVAKRFEALQTSYLYLQREVSYHSFNGIPKLLLNKNII